MRLERITVDNYGPLRGLDWIPPDVAVVYDDNMAGKTALVDVLIRHLFIPRKGSKLFRNYSRFNNGDPPRVNIEVRKGGTNFSFGTHSKEEIELKELFGWPEEELFRLLCIRAGDHRLVRGNGERNSVFNAVASLVAGAGTDKIARMDRDLREEFRITGSNNWSNRKTTHPPKIKEAVQEEILPFLEDFSRAEKTLHQVRKLRTEIEEQEETLEELEEREESLEVKLQLVRAEKLEQALARIDDLDNQLEKYGRISSEDEEAWQEAKEKLERNRKRLSRPDYRGKRPEKRLKELNRRIENKKELLENEIDKRLREKRERKRNLKEKIAKGKRAAKEARRSASTTLRENVREPLERLNLLEERRGALEFWADRRGTIGAVSLALVAAGLLGGLLYYWFLGLLSLGGLLTIVVALKRARDYDDLKEEIRMLKEEIRRDFNSKFGSLFERRIRGTDEIKRVMEEVPFRMEERVKGEKSLEEIKTEKSSVEKELAELKERKKRLPEEIEELQSDRERLEKEISGIKEKIEEGKAELADLREKTNLSDLSSLKEKLKEKEDLRESLRREEEKLQAELDLEELKEENLQSRARRRIEELRREGEDQALEPREETSELGELESRFTRDLEELAEEITEKREKIKEKREELRRAKAELAGFGVDSNKPGELFKRKIEAERKLKEFIRDRIAGSIARETLEETGNNYLKSIDRFVSGDSEECTVRGLFAQVMGERFELDFEHENKEFIVREKELSYPENDLSSGAKKHLLLSVRLALVKEVAPEPGFLVLDDPFLFYHEKRKKKAIEALRPFVEEGWQLLVLTVDEGTKNGAVRELGGRELSFQDLKG
ncbi:MAG: ATP-binding protein [Candidatus Acetothermia bacterium]